MARKKFKPLGNSGRHRNTKTTRGKVQVVIKRTSENSRTIKGEQSRSMSIGNVTVEEVDKAIRKSLFGG